MTTDQILIPFNRQAEQALLGSVLIDPEAYHDVAAFLDAGDFYIERHRWLWQAFGKLHEAHIPLDYVTVLDELERQGKLAEIGGSAFVSELLNITPTSLHAEYYGRIVEEDAVRRRMLQAANDVAKLAYEEEQEIEQVLGQAEKVLQNASERRSNGTLKPLSIILDRLFEQTDETAKARAQGKLRGIPTGFPDLDKLLYGMQPSDVLIVAGRPGMGKTAFLLSIARHAALVNHKHIAMFSLEMSDEQMGLRIMAQQSGINTQRLREALLSPDEWVRFNQAVEQLEKLPLVVDQTPALTPQQLFARCRKLQRESGLDLVIVDYLQLMQGVGRFEGRNQEIGYISRQLKIIARELNVPILAAAQLSRAVEQRADKRPILSDLRESGSIEQDADVVIFLYRTETEKKSETSLVEVSVAKHRNGPTGVIQLPYRADLTRFEPQKP